MIFREPEIKEKNAGEVTTEFLHPGAPGQPGAGPPQAVPPSSENIQERTGRPANCLPASLRNWPRVLRFTAGGCCEQQLSGGAQPLQPPTQLAPATLRLPLGLRPRSDQGAFLPP